MSRYGGNRRSEPILNAGEHWKSIALLTDGSVFDAGQVWTPTNLEALTEYFVNQRDDGGGSYYDKLETQLAPTAPEVKQLAAEMLWFMLLCPDNIGASKKRSGIETIWEWSKHPFPEDSSWLSDDALAGVGSAGISFSTNRWRELVYFIRVMTTFKKLPQAEKDGLLSNGLAFAKWLGQIPEGQSRQLRHMMLFLLFPDNFERIFGGTDRKKIVSAFTGKSMHQVRSMSAIQIDHP